MNRIAQFSGRQILVKSLSLAGCASSGGSIAGAERGTARGTERRNYLLHGGPDRSSATVWRHEIAAARALGLPITSHVASDLAAIS